MPRSAAGTRAAIGEFERTEVEFSDAISVCRAVLGVGIVSISAVDSQLTLPSTRPRSVVLGGAHRAGGHLMFAPGPPEILGTSWGFDPLTPPLSFRR
jgi:hypothetical protein